MNLIVFFALLALFIAFLVWALYKTRPSVRAGSGGFRNGAAGQFTPAPNVNAAALLRGLSPTERCVLAWMHDDIAHPARRIAERSGVPIAEVRTAQRKFKAEGVAAFGPIYDGAAMVGSGYWLTPDGNAMRKECRRLRENLFARAPNAPPAFA